MKGIHKLTVALLTVVAVSTWNTTFATSMTIDVEGTDSASHSGAISTGTLNKTNAGALALSGTNAIGALGIHGGKVSVSSASNLNGASSAVTFAASGTDPVTAAANTAKLHITDDMSTGAFNFATDGEVEVDASKTATLSAAPTGTGLVTKTGAGVMKVASDLGPVATSFNTADGFFESGSNQIAWPSNLTGYVPYGMTDGNPNWYTNDTYDHGLTYGGVTLNFGWNPSLGDPDGLIYWAPLGNLTGAHPTVPTPIAGIHVDAGTLYVQSGKAPVAPIQIASGAILELGSGATGAVPGAVTFASGAEMLVDASVTVTPTIAGSSGGGNYYAFNWDSVSDSDLSGYLAIYTPGWSSVLQQYQYTGSPIIDPYTNISLSYISSSNSWLIVAPAGESVTGSYLGDNNGIPQADFTISAGGTITQPIAGGDDYCVTVTDSTAASGAFGSTVLFQSGSKLALGAGSTWARDIIVGTAS